MSEVSNLYELARFAGKSPLAGDDPLARRRLASALARTEPTGSPRRSVGELVGAVLALSARARRTAMPQVEIELDVFSPSGRRAVRLFLPQRV